MHIPDFEEIVEPNDQTKARREHLEALGALVGNVYPNKFDRTRLTGDVDTITNILNFGPVAKIVGEIKSVVSTLKEGERPPVDVKDALNSRLKELGNVRVAGRLAVPPRVMGKAAFVHLSDGMSRLQIYVRRDDVKGVVNGKRLVVNEEPSREDLPLTTNHSPLPSGWEIFQLLDHGDFIGVEGFLFITNTGELSVHVEKLQFLAKAMVPMPDKMHGIEDPEIKQRRRYADLIGSSLQVEHDGLTTRQVFETRAKVISSMRRFLEDHDYIEVETPMLTPKATGAAAKPFETHHNALDITLYARIAPELYLKRLVVGGFEKVYELNRNFRNEGISYKHNPEFTMLEFYCAYMDVNGMMDFCEELLRQSVQKATGGLAVEYEGKEIDFSRFNRLSMRQAILNVKSSIIEASLPNDNAFRELINDERWIEDPKALYRMGYLVKDTRNRKYVNQLQTFYLPDNPEDALQLHPVQDAQKIRDLQGQGYVSALSVNTDSVEVNEERKRESWEYWGKEYDNNEVSNGQAITMLFESAVEPDLISPTFITDFPKIISPLSKASPENPAVAERFELFINGMEVANGFSELNDPKEQYERFIEQMSERERGDEEAMILDEDYIRALSYGMPPAAGIGIGIDRLVMLLTNKHSIRDVILFPHLRPERKELAAESTEED